MLTIKDSSDTCPRCGSSDLVEGYSMHEPAIRCNCCHTLYVYCETCCRYVEGASQYMCDKCAESVLLWYSRKEMAYSPLQIMCECEHIINEDAICPFCGRVYRRCEQCREWTVEDDLVEGWCESCRQQYIIDRD
jgi:hypothetical protein